MTELKLSDRMNLKRIAQSHDLRLLINTENYYAQILGLVTVYGMFNDISIEDARKYLAEELNDPILDTNFALEQCNEFMINVHRSRTRNKLEDRISKPDQMN